ncbi:MAG: hypothetical protein WC511_00005 [Candidatus Pacearchaeota archaeon]
MSLVRKLFLPLVVAGAIALFPSCQNPTGPEKPEEPVTEQPGTEQPGTDPTTPDPTQTITNDYAPVITSTPNLSVNEGEIYNYQVVVTDADGNPLTPSIVAPAWLSVSPTGLVSGTAPLIDADTVDLVKINLSDGKHETVQEYNLRNQDLETRAAITKAADRLITLQDNNGLPSVKGNPSGAVDGSWDWDVTNKTGPTNQTFLNITGVSADVLLDAFRITNDSKYLDAAKRAGNYIITELDKLSENRHFNAFNMVFLKDLANVSGDVTYSNYVAKKMNDLKTKVTTHPSGNLSTDGVAGLTPEELVAAENVIRGAADAGIKSWDLYHFVQLAKEAGDNDYATRVASGIKTQLEKASYNSSTKGYELGLAAGVIALKEAGLDETGILERLVVEQDSDGHFETPDYPDEHTQPTAYALMALKKAGRTDNAIKASKYLIANQIANGGWLEDGVEYSEVDSEAGHGIAKLIQ